jgi:hypothetical protein
MAVVIVGIPVVILIILFGVLKVKVKHIIPQTDTILLVIAIIFWILTLKGVYEVNADSWKGAEGWQYAIGFFIVSIIYWFIVGCIKLIILPVEFIGDAIKPDENEKRNTPALREQELQDEINMLKAQMIEQQQKAKTQEVVTPAPKKRTVKRKTYKKIPIINTSSLN